MVANKFTQSEEIGRVKFDKWITDNCDVCSKPTYAKNQYSTWDVAFTSGDTRVVAEIKDRKVSHTEYFTFLGEKVKLDKLQALVKEGKTDVVIYFNSFMDDYVRTWDITDYKPFITYKKPLPATTDGNNRKILKEVYDLYQDDSKLFKI